MRPKNSARNAAAVVPVLDPAGILTLAPSAAPGMLVVDLAAEPNYQAAVVAAMLPRPPWWALAMARILRTLGIRNAWAPLDPLTDPAHDRDGHAVAQGLVARAVGGGLPTVGDQGVVIGEAHQSFTFTRREPPNLHPGVHELAGVRPAS